QDVFKGVTPFFIADAITIVEALSWLIENRVQVVNISLTGPENRLLEAATARAAEAGLIQVAAAGNDGNRAEPSYPAAYPHVIAVTAVDRRARAYTFNTQGDYIDIAAPGVDVWAANAATGGAALWSGTSFAAPFVSVALARAVQTGDVADITTAREFLAVSARDLGPRGRDRMFGYGLLQAPECLP
ncbi:MAG: S8 family serine peptidase, partial [Pseudomonadota bacterium]